MPKERGFFFSSGFQGDLCPRLKSLKDGVCSQGVKIPENGLGKHAGQAASGEEPTQGLLEPAPGPARAHNEGLLAGSCPSQPPRAGVSPVVCCCVFDNRPWTGADFISSV